MKRKKTLKYIIILLSIFLLWFIIHTSIVVYKGNQKSNMIADAGIIFGAKNNPDGSLSEALKRRLNVGLELYNHKQINKIIVTGGPAFKGMCEADIMQIYLLNRGVPLSAIILENKASNTVENVDNSLKFIDSLHIKSIIIVSQYYHISRIKLMFDKRGFHNYSSSSSHHSDLFTDPFILFREFLAYYYYLIFN